MTEKIISRGKCSGLPATLWSNLSVETTHLSRGSYSTGQSHGRKSVVRGLLRVPSIEMGIFDTALNTTRAMTPMQEG